MKATIVYTVHDTTKTKVIEAPYISSQLWDNGRAIVFAHKRKGGKMLRAWHSSRVWEIEVER